MLTTLMETEVKVVAKPKQKKTLKVNAKRSDDERNGKR